MIAGLLPAPHPLHAAEPEPSVERLEAHVRFLASDDLEGRNAGQPGSEKAAAWLAERFAEIGLEGAGDDGSHRQAFTFAVRGASGAARASTVNVVGLLRGSDPDLARETIVIGAHYDHVGRAAHPDSGRIGGPAGEDDTWNGADDNASGTAAVLEIARCLAGSERRPRRSILFVLFGAEEHGLLGSRHYVSAPLRPLADTVAMVNLDMVGRNAESPISVTGVASAAERTFDGLLDEAQRADRGLRLDRMGITIPGGSDHTPFALSRVPALFVSTGLHEDYHRASDHADKIAYDNVARIARLVVALARGLADRDGRAGFSFATANPFPTLGRLALRQLEAPLYLGAASARATDDGVVLGAVVGRGPGGRAGLQRGDIIRAVEGRSTLGSSGLDDLRAALDDADRFGTTRLTIRRAGADLEVIVVWRG